MWLVLLAVVISRHGSDRTYAERRYFFCKCGHSTVQRPDHSVRAYVETGSADEDRRVIKWTLFISNTSVREGQNTFIFAPPPLLRRKASRQRS